MFGQFLCLSLALILPGQAAPGTSQSAGQQRLDQLLRQWEQRTRNIRDLYCEFKVETLDAVFREKRTETGRAWALRPYYGRLDLKDDQGNERIFIATDKAIHQYEFKTKQEIVHLLPPATQQEREKMLPGGLSFIFGMSAAEAKRRFKLELYKEDQQYAWVLAIPRYKIDQQDFVKADLVFDKKTYLPIQLKIVEPNGNQQRWIFTRIHANVNPPLTKEKLAPLKVPVERGWKTIVNRWDQQQQAAREQPAGRGNSQKR